MEERSKVANYEKEGEQRAGREGGVVGRYPRIAGPWAACLAPSSLSGCFCWRLPFLLLLLPLPLLWVWISRYSGSG